jgi:Fibronectin type III domain
MRLSSIRFMLTVSLALLTGLVLTSCDNTEDLGTNPNTIVIAGPSNLKAFSLDSTSVGLTWDLSPDELMAEVKNPAYQIQARDSIGNNFLLSAVKGQSSATFPNLTEGRVYTFVIRIVVDSTAISNDSSVVRWAPAKRREREGNAPIQIFESASASFPSGLDVFSSSANGPVTLAISGTSNALVDLYVFTETGSQDLLIRSASESNVIQVPKTTFFSTSTVDGDDLNDPRSSPPAISTYSLLQVRIPAGTNFTAGKIFFGRTQENNYFRLLVTRNNNSLIFGSSPDRFVTVKISYQGAAGVPFAKPGSGDGKEWE